MWAEASRERRKEDGIAKVKVRRGRGGKKKNEWIGGQWRFIGGRQGGEES